MQSLPQLTRQKIFELNTLILYKHTNAIKTMQEGFADTIIKQMDGEKDPRCLVLVFRYIPVVLHHFPVDHCLEDLFDVTSCYFPITFTPPPDDPIGISQKELIESLQVCMAATYKFAPFLMSLIFHKMGSGIDVAKSQSYGMIEYCAKSYGPVGLRPALSQIYTSVRTELFQSFDDEIKKTALQCLTVVVAEAFKDGAGEPAAQGGEAAGSTAMDTEGTPKKDFLDDLIAESVRHLRDFDVGLIRLHGRLLKACALGSEMVCQKICQSMLPAIRKELEQEPTKDHIISYVAVLQALMDAAIAIASSNTSCISLEQHGWLKTTFMKCLTDDDETIRKLALEGLSKVVNYNVPVDLPELCVSFVEKCLSDPQEKVVAAANKALSSLAVQHPDVVFDHALPTFKAALEAEAVSDTTAKQVLAAIGGVSTSWKLDVTILTIYLDFIQHLDTAGASPTTATEELTAVVGDAISKVLSIAADNFPTEDLFTSLIRPCTKLLLSTLVDGGQTLLWHPAVQGSICDGLRSCCQAMPASQQREMLRISISVFRDGVTEDLGLHLPKLGTSCVWLLCSVVCRLFFPPVRNQRQSQ